MSHKKYLCDAPQARTALIATPARPRPQDVVVRPRSLPRTGVGPCAACCSCTRGPGLPAAHLRAQPTIYRGHGISWVPLPRLRVAAGLPARSTTRTANGKFVSFVMEWRGDEGRTTRLREHAKSEGAKARALELSRRRKEATNA